MDALSKNQLKNLLAYTTQKKQLDENLFVVEGEKMCNEALNASAHIIITCATADYYNSHNIGNSSQKNYIVTNDQLLRLSNMKSPNKVWMLVERPIIPLPIKASLTIALDSLQDPGNMGTIMRIADWYGIRHIVCSRNTVSCYNPKVVQASMGAIFRTRIDYLELTEWLNDQATLGTRIYGATLDGTSLYNTRFDKPAVIVVGNEGAGISPNVASCIGQRITIPNIGGTCESLNAAVATAIICSEFYR